MPLPTSILPNVIGLIPAAGQATRLAPLPGSKELYPIGLSGEGNTARPRVVSHFLLEAMRRAGIGRAFFILREGKWDIPAYYKDGAALLDMSLGYLIMRHPYGPAFTLDAAYPFVRGATVAIGFPDIVFQPEDAYAHCLARLQESGADAVLGLVPYDRAETADMVDRDEAGRVRAILIKQPAPHLRYSWVVAVWASTFTEFMHGHLAGALQQLDLTQEWHVGRVVQAALGAGLRVESVAFPEGGYVDYGSPEALRRVYASESVT